LTHLRGVRGEYFEAELECYQAKCPLSVLLKRLRLACVFDVRSWVSLGNNHADACDDSGCAKMESLVYCETCNHGAIVHEAGGCTQAKCPCRKTLGGLVEEALEAARVEIRREWHVSS